MEIDLFSTLFKHTRLGSFVFIPMEVIDDIVYGYIGIDIKFSIPIDYFVQEWIPTNIELDSFLRQVEEFPTDTHYSIIFDMFFDEYTYPRGYIYFDRHDNNTIPLWKFIVCTTIDEKEEIITPFNTVLQIDHFDIELKKCIENELDIINKMRLMKSPFMEGQLQGFEFGFICLLDEKFNNI